jgi:hypothetical protein
VSAPSPSEFERAALQHGISEKALQQQRVRLQSGPSFCAPDAPCQRGSGIQTLSDAALKSLAERGANLHGNQAIRFVPASGAASRMFKALATGQAQAVEQLNARWAEFPFRAAAEETGPCADAQQRLGAVMNALNLPDMPKGGLPFHLYAEGARTAFEEHMHEWRATLPHAEQPLVHFTLPEAGRAAWEAKLSQWAAKNEIRISSSVQHPSTDTMALGDDGKPFVTSEGQPLFRPGGHGALLHNLAALGVAHPRALVSIKNIDNVRPTTAHGEVLPWRQALLGLSVQLNESRLEAMAALASGNKKPAQMWLTQGFRHPGEPQPDDVASLIEALDRPLLVAGMVRNEGEPGGGPFWLRDAEGVLRAQIVESAEMDLGDPRIGNCIAGATHFNPVDLVCVMHDAEGQPYDLQRFVDKRRDFLVSKSHGGRPLIGLEHPGLWNGAMGLWNTYFVEVPSSTFAPVKTVFDLLRPAHQV